MVGIVRAWSHILLWGMQASGDTLIVGRSLYLILLYLMIFANNFCALVCTSKSREVLAHTCIIAASILPVDHNGPQFTVHPSVENYCRRGFPLWWVSYVHGHMSPILTILYLIFRHSGIDI